MGLIRKEATHVNRSSRTPAGNRWKHEHLRLIWTLIPRSFVIVLLLMVLSVGVVSAHSAKQPVAKKTAVKKQVAVKSASTKKAVPVKAVASANTSAKSKLTAKPVQKAKTSSSAKKKTVKKAPVNTVAKSATKKAPSKKTVASAAKKSAPVAAAKVRTAAAVQTPKGMPDKKYIRKVLTGVTVYAYAPSSTKKSNKKKSAIGKYTATGTLATAGRTIAVDPKQIPLGWWVYVEGMGYRKAEDVGGAIKGKKIDVFVSSYRDAIIFGVKKNRKVYVIGPNLPKTAASPAKSASSKQKAPSAAALPQITVAANQQPKADESSVISTVDTVQESEVELIVQPVAIPSVQPDVPQLTDPAAIPFEAALEQAVIPSVEQVTPAIAESVPSASDPKSVATNL